MKFLRRLVVLALLLIPTVFLTITRLILGTAYFITAKHNTLSPKIVPSALLPLTLQGNTSKTFPVVTGRKTKGFYFRWLTNIKSKKISLNFRRRENPQHNRKSLIFSYK
jgi:hypothetical protein